MSDLPTKAPRPTPENQAFWDATAEDRFVLQRCTSCASVIWWPRAMCPDCGSFELELFDASGDGKVYSFSINRKGGGSWREASPYIVAYVELDEGPRLMTNIVECDPESVHIDMPVTLAWADTGEGTKLPRFMPK